MSPNDYKWETIDTQSHKVITKFQKRGSDNSLIPVSFIPFKIELLFNKSGVSLTIGNKLGVSRGEGG